jgi:hypothetical protein
VEKIKRAMRLEIELAGLRERQGVSQTAVANSRAMPSPASDV